MNEGIIDRRLFVDLTKEIGLNASHIEAMGEMRHCEITVSGNMLERLVEIQHQFERFADAVLATMRLSRSCSLNGSCLILVSY